VDICELQKLLHVTVILVRMVELALTNPAANTTVTVSLGGSARTVAQVNTIRSRLKNFEVTGPHTSSYELK